ncbi:hypothetical protein, partial [Escherichia coli]|uniref:hypothetical protein n=1 Tax=Escherichia coli TaxID=562 RepID=UPI001B8BFA88
KQKKLIMLPSETMIWQPEFTDKTLSRKPGAVHLACQPHERVVALERHSLCKLIFTPRPSRCAYTLDKYVNDKLKIIRAFPVTILVVGNEISLADRKCT